MAKQKGWLDKYGEEINANEGHSSAPKEWIGEGYSNVGRDYSPAWGGQFEDGGYIPQAQKGKKVIIDGKEYDTSSEEYKDLYRFGPNDDSKGGIGYFDKDGVLVTGKTTLPEVVVFPKDKDTKEFYDDLGDSDQYAFEQMVKKYGPVNITKNKGKGIFSGTAGHYNPFTDQITIDPNQKFLSRDKDTYLAELAHKVQFDRQGKFDVMGNWTFHDLPDYMTGNSPYEDSSTTEYQAHGVIEPALKDEFYNYSSDDMMGYNYNKFNMGGSLPGSTGFMYARTSGAAPSNGPYAKKTKASAQNGLTFLEPNSSKLPIGYANIPSNVPSSELAQSIGGENGEPAFLIPTFKYGQPLEDANAEFRKTGEHLGGPFKTWQEADEWERTVRHPYVEKGQSIPTPLRRWGKDFENGGSMSYYQNGLDWKPKSISRDGSVIKAQNGKTFEEITGIKPITSLNNATDVIGKTPTQIIKDNQKAQEIVNRNIATNKRQFLNQGQATTKESEARRKTLTKQAVNQLPNVTYNEQTGTTSAVNPNMTYTGEPANFMGERQQKAVDHILGALEATGYVTGAGELIGAGYNALKPIIAESMESGLLSKTHTINPWAFKPQEGMMYRGLGQEGMEDAIRSGVFRPKQLGYAPNRSLAEKVTTPKQFENTFYAPAEEFGAVKGYGPNYLAEVPFEGNQFGRRYGRKNWSWSTPKQIPIDEGNILKKDWWQGYKKVPKSTQSTIQGATDVDATVQAQIDKYFRKQTLPESTNSNFTSVLDDFRQRIQTPEGQERLKALGITSDDYLKELKLIEDEYSYGYHDPGESRIAINPGATGQLARNAIRHEIEHAVQESLRLSNIAKVRAAENQDFWGSMLKKNRNPEARLAAMESGPTEIDEILSGLELRKEGTNPNWEEIRKNSPQFKEKVDWNDIATSFKDDTQKATDYFLTGSEGQERAPFLAEAQQYMLDKGYIKHPYETITPDKVKEVFAEARFDKESPLRIFNIIKASDKNYDLIAKALNKMLTITPIVGGAAAATYQVEQKKQGGVVKDNNGYWNPDNWGKVVEIDSPDITMKGVDQDLIGISDEGDVQYMTPGKNYKFKGKKVREYPVGKNGVNQQDEKVAQQLDQLTNFTNYNKPTKGGWLDKYN